MAAQVLVGLGFIVMFGTAALLLGGMIASWLAAPEQARQPDREAENQEPRPFQK